MDLVDIATQLADKYTFGMITAPLLSMFVIPAAYLLMRRPRKPVSRGYNTKPSSIEG